MPGEDLHRSGEIDREDQLGLGSSGKVQSPCHRLRCPGSHLRETKSRGRWLGWLLFTGRQEFLLDVFGGPHTNLVLTPDPNLPMRCSAAPARLPLRPGLLHWQLGEIRSYDPPAA